MTNGDKMKFLREQRFMDGKHHKYTNSAQINGFLLSKPREMILPNGNIALTFYLLQINETKYTFYPCQVFSKPIIEQLKNMKTCCFINVLGRLVYSQKTRYSLQVEEMSITHEFLNLELEETYKPKGE